ncbi:MAG: hypothetical protein ACJ8EF_19215 [Bradyrhizobium sp.]
MPTEPLRSTVMYSKLLMGDLALDCDTNVPGGGVLIKWGNFERSAPTQRGLTAGMFRR